MATINNGEKHVFLFRLLDSSDNVIDWADVNELTLELSTQSGKNILTWTKTGGGITESNSRARVELDTQNVSTGTYYIKGTINVADTRWESDTSNDISWYQTSISVTNEINEFNTNKSQGDIKFSVVL